MSSTSTTEYVKRVLEKYGYRYGLVERFNHHTLRRTDFCGFADVLAFRRAEVVRKDEVEEREEFERLFQWYVNNLELGGSEVWYDATTLFRGCLAVQSCAASTLNKHVDKILGGDVVEQVKDWLEAGNRFEMWGWRKVVGKTGKRRRYLPKIVRVSLDLKSDEFWVSDDSEVELWGWEPKG
jgi:hypothetical protein